MTLLYPVPLRGTPKPGASGERSAFVSWFFSMLSLVMMINIPTVCTRIASLENMFDFHFLVIVLLFLVLLRLFILTFGLLPLYGILVPKPPNVNVVRSMWLFRHKYHADGLLSSPIVKRATIHTVLSLALTRNWHVHQLDVKNAFLNVDLFKTVYMYQPPGFVDSRYALRVGFTSSRCDSSLFIYQHGTEVSYLLIYVDDIVLTASSIALLQHARGMFLSQKKYAMELLERAHMSNCNTTRTPVDTESKLSSDGDPVSNSTLYRSLACGLQYLTFTRPYISYVVQHICLHMHDPREPYLAALKRDARPLDGLLQGIVCSLRIGDNLLSWSSKRQHTLSRSSAEAEYRGVANVVAETAWLRNLLRELHTPLLYATLVYCDYVRVLHVPSRYQYADIFTKGLPSVLFEEFRISLSVRSSLAQTAGEC
ncbi:ribonuclease H-like domain-containing protein [Tanacetum coccineum]